MDIWLAFIVLLVGFVFLVKGADFFVDGASSIAKYFKISTLVIGLTVVAFGTSLPEAAVSITSAIQNVDDVSLGNVIGSNLFNLLLILGVSALVFPVSVSKQIVKRDLPYSILGPILLIGMIYFFHESNNQALIRLEGIILLLFFSLYMFITMRGALKQPNLETYEQDESSTIAMSKSKAWVLTLIGLVGIVLGGIMVTNGAKTIALYFGMSEWLVGLTVVSLGTSLPELVTSVVAALKKENDIAVGNVVGSNIFNIFLVLGISAAISPISLTSQVVFDILFLIIGSLALLGLIVFRKGKLGRMEGALLTLMYVGYFVYIFIRDFQ